MAIATDISWKTIAPSSNLRYTKGYFLLPAFAPIADISWKGASEIVKQYNFTAPNNFTLERLPIKPIQELQVNGVGYVLCIKYRVGDMVYRYKLWQNVGEILNVPLYNGELIKKNFCLEIWTTANVLEVYQAKALKLRTNVTKAISSFSSISDFELCVGADSGDNTIELSPPTNIVEGAIYTGDDLSIYEFDLEIGVTYRVYFGANDFALEYNLNGVDNVSVYYYDHVGGYYEFTPIAVGARLTYITTSGGNGVAVTATLNRASEETALVMPLDNSNTAWLDNNESETDEVGEDINLGLGEPITDAGGDILTDTTGNPIRES